MNFFSAQDAARKSTILLVLLFLSAVLSLILLTNLLIMAFLGSFDLDPTYLGAGQPTGLAGFFERFDWGNFLAIGAAVTLVVLAGSLYKISALSGGRQPGGRVSGGTPNQPGHHRSHA